MVIKNHFSVFIWHKSTIAKIVDTRTSLFSGWPTADPTLMSQYLQQICVPLRSHGFTDNNVDEIVRSIRCLAKHGILTLDTNTTKPAKSPPPAIWNQDSSVPGKSLKQRCR